MRKKGFTLIELLVVIAIIAMLLAILMPALNKVKKIAQRVVCGTNLKGLGTAQVVYANDYNDSYVQQAYLSPKTFSVATDGYQAPAMDFANTAGNVSVGASLYLLVREADVSPKSFVCPSGGEKAFEGQNLNTTDNPDITEMWDFGNPAILPALNLGPANCVSYSYHSPYNQYAADGTRSAAFAVMADRNPWFDPKLYPNSTTPITVENWIDGVHFIFNDWDAGGTAQKWTTNRANAQPHDRDGQNVMFGDGHNAFEKRSDVGVRHDGIYTRQNDNHIRQGGQPTMSVNLADHVPVGSRDSYLINDSRGN